MDVQAFHRGDAVCLTSDVLDEGQIFRVGDTGRVRRYDKTLVRVRMFWPRGYEICIWPTRLKHMVQN